MPGAIRVFLYAFGHQTFVRRRSDRGSNPPDRVGVCPVVRPVNQIEGDIRLRIRNRDLDPLRRDLPPAPPQVCGKARKRGAAGQLLHGEVACLDMEAGGRHLLGAQVVPEAQVRSQQKIMSVQVIKRHGRIFREGMLRRHADGKLLFQKRHTFKFFRRMGKRQDG